MSQLGAFAVDRRQQVLVAAAALVGVVTGLLVAAFNQLTRKGLLDNLLSAGLAAQAIMPLVGLGVAALALRYVAGGASPSTADEFLTAFHGPTHEFRLREVAGRMLASIATLGAGGALGFEGPSIYLGAAVGSAVQRRVARWIHRDEAKALLVAGAAGGVAAIFRAPATGVLFALEVPYTDDIARRGLIPALVAAASSYVTFVAIVGTEPLLHIGGASGGFELGELVAAVTIGLAAGLGARGMAWLLRRAKAWAGAWPWWQRLPLAGGGLAALALVSHHVFGQAFTVGPGYRIMPWLQDPRRALLVLLVLFVLRLVATALSVAGGGAGGLFVPLVVQGAVLGRLVAGCLDGIGLHPHSHLLASSALLPLLGIAAFLGAGYRTPLAAVMFVAESTGRALFVVPALVASAVSQLVMARSSVTTAQLPARTGHLERRFTLPITAALSTDVLTVPPDATIDEFVIVHAVGNRQRILAVVDDGHYVGMCRLEDAAAVEQEEWATTSVASVARTDLPEGRLGWTLRDAVVAMEDADVDRIAVVDSDRTFVGEVRRSEIVRLDQILEDTER